MLNQKSECSTLQGSKLRGSLDRRSFLKTAGAGILGAGLCSLAPFTIFSHKEAMAAAEQAGKKSFPRSAVCVGLREIAGSTRF